MNSPYKNTELQTVCQSLAVGPACGGKGELGCLLGAKFLLLLLAVMKAETAVFAAGDCMPAAGPGSAGEKSCWDPRSGLLVINAGGFANSLIARPMVLRFLARAAWPSSLFCQALTCSNKLLKRFLLQKVASLSCKGRYSSLQTCPCTC